MLVVRWLGAFRGGAASLTDSLAYELDRASEVAAEWMISGEPALITRARVGLVVKKSAVTVKFNGDCWSEYKGGALVKTRNPREARTKHRECFAIPVYTGIVIKGGFVSKDVLKTLEYFAKKYSLKIQYMNSKGELKCR